MMNRQRLDLQIAVLAAGFSTRLGQSKALARVHRVSLLSRTIAVLAHVTQQNIIVVAPPRADRMRAELRRFRVTFVDNPRRGAGLSASVARALRRSRWSAGTLLLPVDLVHLTSRDIDRLITRWRGGKRRVVARDADGRAATPLILPKFLYPLAGQLAGDIGLRDLLGKLPPWQRTLMNLPSAAEDIDSPAQLAAARRRAPRPLRLPRGGLKQMLSADR
jgi:molybdenum cofactor cytidylyltransferase